MDRDMVRAAEFLCPRVRELAVSARQGGEELSAWLRREYGMPVRPDGEGITAAVRFDEAAPGGGVICDAGCGLGFSSLALAPYFQKVVAADKRFIPR